MTEDDKMFSPFAISLVDSTFNPSVQPTFVYQNLVKGVHGVLERVCFVTERVRGERERGSTESIVQRPVTLSLIV